MGCSFIAPIQDAVNNIYNDVIKPVIVPAAAVAAAIYAPELLAAYGTEGAAAMTAEELAAAAAASGGGEAVVGEAIAGYGGGGTALAPSVLTAGSAPGAALAAETAAGAAIPAVAGTALAPSVLTAGSAPGAALAAQTALDAGASALAGTAGAGMGVAAPAYSSAGANALAGTAGAGIGVAAPAYSSAVPGATSVNEMVASGMAPGSAGAAGAASGELTGNALADASGVSTLGSGVNLGNVGTALNQIGSGAQPLLSTLGSLYSGASSADAIQRATDQLMAGGTAATGTIKQYLDPYITAGQPALARMAAGVAPGGEFTNTFTMADAQNSPAMLNAQAQGADVIQNAAAAKGGLLGTNTLADLTKFGQGNAAQYENQAFNQWLANRNANQGAVAGMVNLGSGASGTAANDIASIQISDANAAAKNTIAGANATNQGVTNAIGTAGQAIGGLGQLAQGVGSLYSAFNA